VYVVKTFIHSCLNELDELDQQGLRRTMKATIESIAMELAQDCCRCDWRAEEKNGSGWFVVTRRTQKAKILLRSGTKKRVTDVPRHARATAPRAVPRESPPTATIQLTKGTSATNTLAIIMNSNHFQHDTTGRLSAEDAMMLESPQSSPATSKVIKTQNDSCVGFALEAWRSK
jgi:hypothetical protein